MRIARSALLAGTVLLIIGSILAGFIWLMPRASVGHIAEAQLQKATGFRYHVQIDGASLSGLSGIKATDIHLSSRERVSENLPPGTLNIDVLKVRAGVLSLLRRQPSIRTRIDFPSGHALILLHQGKEERRLEAQFFDVALDDLGLLRDYARVPLAGTLRGSIEGTVNEENLLVDADVDMNILGFVAGPRTLSGSDLPADVQRFFAGDITIPALDSGDILIRGAVDESDVFVIDEFVGQGDDLRLKAEGQVVPKTPAAQSELSLKLSVAIEPEWVERAQLGMIIDNVPMVSQAQQGDNLVFSITGPVNKPKFAAASDRQRLR